MLHDSAPRPLCRPAAVRPRPAPAPALWLSRLQAADFRNHRRVRLELDSRSVLLLGANGSGKTSLLEAISLLGPGRGLRRAPHVEIARAAGPGGWSVAAGIERGAESLMVGTGFAPPATEGPGPRRGRAVRIGGKAASGPGALSRVVSLLWLTPAMERLLIEGPPARRGFVDRITAGLNPDHARHAAAYQRAMRARARLLAAAAPPPDRHFLDSLEAQAARHGLALACARRRIAAGLQDLLADPADPAFPAAQLRLQGRFEAALEDNPGQAEAWLRRALAESRQTRASPGPHRTQVEIRHLSSGVEAAACSSGEQKALLAAILLAAARLARRLNGAAPLLLLDEAAAHLDPERRAGLFRALRRLPAQVWLTGTEASPFAAFLPQAQIFAVAPGAARPL